MAKGIKTGGRKKGTPNKLTKELRTILKELLYKELDKLPEHLETLEPKDRIAVSIKLLPFVLPNVRSVHYTENEESVVIDWL